MTVEQNPSDVRGMQSWAQAVTILCKFWFTFRPNLVVYMPTGVVAAMDSVASVVCPFADSVLKRQAK